MATIKNLVLEQGATFSANIQYLNSNKRPISLAGYNIRSKMRTSYDAANAASFVTVVTDAANGNVNLSLTASNTALLEYGRYVYDVEAYAGNIVLRIVEGTVNVTPGVSGPHLGSLLKSGITTSDLPEGTNLYYTNARVKSLLTKYDDNIIPTVSNTYNLGSPDLRWKSLYLEATTINLGNVAISVDELTGNLTFTDTSTANNAVTLVASSIQLGTGTNAVILGANTGTLQTVLQPNSITGVEIADGSITLSKLGNINTANVPESASNLYFTPARAIASFTAGANIYISPAGVISSTGGGGNVNLAGVATESNLALKANLTQLNTSNVTESINNLYYTNARVYSNVISLLNVKANIAQLNTSNVSESASNLYFTNARAIAAFTAGSNITISANGVISSTGSGGGGGGSGTVVLADLTTANVNEVASSGNLYYTNARVYSNILTSLSTYRGNITANIVTSNIITTSNITANIITVGNVAANIVTVITGNTITTGNIAANIFTANAITANIITVGNVAANIVTVITGNTIATSNVNANAITANIITVGTSNANSNVSVVTIITGNTIATGNISANNINANIITVGTSNANSNVSVVTVITGNTIATGNISANNINANIIIVGNNNSNANSNVNIFTLITGNTISTGNISVNIFTSNIITANIITVGTSNANSNISVVTVITGNTIATGNINASNVNANIITVGNVAANIITVITGNTITLGNIAANIITVITGNTIATSNISANNINANIIIVGNSNANIFTVITGNTVTTGNVNANIITSNISVSNIFTTGNITANIITSNTIISNIITTGNISANSVSATSVTFTNLTVTGITNFYGNVTTYSSNNLSISDNMIYLNNGSQSSNPDLGIAFNYNDGAYRHAGFFRDATDGVFKVFDNYSPEPDANIFIDTSHASFRLANIQATSFTGNLLGNITGFVSSISNFTTNSLNEGSSNLYYTNARVYSNVIGLLTNYATTTNLNLKANITDLTNYATVANLNLKANITQLTTSNIVELGSNVYYTNARVYSNTIALLPEYTGNIKSGNLTVGTATGGSILGANLIVSNNITVTTITANTLIVTANPAFRVYGLGSLVGSGTTLSGGNFTTAIDYNQNNAYNSTTGIFTAPVAGYYHIFLNSSFRTNTVHAQTQVAVIKNNATTAGNILCMWEMIENYDTSTFGVSTVAYLAANDNIRAKVLMGQIMFDSNCSYGAIKIG